MERDHLRDPGVGGSIIKIDFQEVGWGIHGLVDLFQDRDGEEPSGSIKCGEILN
jgi:hypothetical protein